jgi:hypothetical protein
MADRTCPKCKLSFKFPSILKIHMKTSFHCITNIEEIENHILNNKEIKTQQNIIIKCNICDNIFKTNSSLFRHKRTSKCGISQSDNVITNSASNEEIVNFIKKLSPKLAKNVEQLMNKRSNQIINNTTNNNDNRIINQTNITNNNTINNTIIQHINPFGFEDVRTIPIPEMKIILSSGNNAGLQIIKAIYNKIENKNFYKPNMSRPEIACLNTDFNLTIYKSKEFCDALFDRCITFLHHMLYLCKNEYSKDAIKNIYDNIEYIETTMRTEIYDKKLQNIIESEFRNNNLDNKDRISKFIKELKDKSETKEQSKLLLNNVLVLNKESGKEYKITINDDEINRVFGDPKLIIGLNKREFIEEFHFKHFEDTKFYKFWTDRIKNEITYINKCKTATIGDIKNIKIRQSKIELMLNMIKTRSELLRGGDLIDLDVEGFIYPEIEGDDRIDNNDINFINPMILEV